MSDNCKRYGDGVPTDFGRVGDHCAWFWRVHCDTCDGTHSVKIKGAEFPCPNCSMVPLSKCTTIAVDREMSEGIIMDYVRRHKLVFQDRERTTTLLTVYVP